MFILKQIEKYILKVRDLLWAYPDLLFWGDKSKLTSLNTFYHQTRPFSHIISSFIIVFLVLTLAFFNTGVAIGMNTTNYIEGVIVGVNEEGHLLGLSRINPLIPTTIQLEKDISNLIYESLVEVDQEGEVKAVLIDSFGEVKAGNHYRFKLKKDIQWHDGEPLTTEDVQETFYLLQRLNRNSDTASNFSNVIATQFDDIDVLDEYSFELKLKSEDAVLPTFFETISFPILPAKYISVLDANSIMSSNPLINLAPIGTGPFKNLSGSPEEGIINLVRNSQYHLGQPLIEKLTFKLFGSEEEAFEALQSARIHSIAGVSTDTLIKIPQLNNYKVYESNVIYNQYWGIYFNLSNNSPEELKNILKNKKVRKAIGYAINRDKLIEIMQNQGEKAVGTIPKVSFAYDKDVESILFDLEKANELLDEEGWRLDKRTGIRRKDGMNFEIEMVYTNNVDRNKVAKIIEENLSEVGIKLTLKPETIQSVNNSYILPRQYEMLLYGQTTFIGPDRYELFHSKQVDLPNQTENKDSTGLNITGYVSEAQDSLISDDKELVKVPKVDVLLEDGRSFIDRAKRKEIYSEFQEIITDESPVIFLYHPKYSYIVNKRVKNVKLDNINNLSNRFQNIYEWEIHV